MRSTRTSAKRARRVSSWPAPPWSTAGFRLGGAYTFLDSKVIRSISSSPIFAPGRHAVSAAASFRARCRRRTRANRVSLALGGVFIGSARRQRLQLPDHHVERGLRHVECERRGAFRATHGRIRDDRQPGRSRIHGAARLSAVSAARCASAFERGSRWRRPPAAISWSGGKDSCAAYHRARDDLRHRRRHHDVQRGRDAEPIARPASRDHRGAGRAAGPAVASRSDAHGTRYDEAFDRALAEAAALGVTHVIFGDILFDEHREWAERLSARPRAHGRRAAVEGIDNRSLSRLPRVGHARADRDRAVEQARRVVPRPRPRRGPARRVRRARRRSVRRARRIPHRRHVVRGLLAPAARPRARARDATADAWPKIWCSMSDDGLAAERRVVRVPTAHRRCSDDVTRRGRARRTRRHPRTQRLGQDDAASTAWRACSRLLGGRVALDGVDLQAIRAARSSRGGWRWCRRRRSSHSSTRCSRWR